MDAPFQTEFSIYLADRPGELAGFLEAAAAAGITFSAIAVADSNGRGCVRLLGRPEERLRELCESMVESGAGPVLESPVVVVPMATGQGFMREISTKLALAGVNVQYAYLAPPENGSPTRCVLRVDNPDAALKAIESIAR
ncbi:MAG: hypothetical protein EA423_08585 [Phycisphaerales bacterium]|nr:MAG: hypothetical protein EA423_08585 [Phycisphaerales bacterium]